MEQNKKNENEKKTKKIKQRKIIMNTTIMGNENSENKECKLPYKNKNIK